MKVFIDVNTYIGHWPFRNLENNALDGLDRLAQDNGITHMMVANIEGFFYKDANQANLSLLKQLRAYTGKTVFIPLAIINPTYPEWQRDAREMIEAGFMGFEIAPVYHFYSFAPEMVYDCLKPIHRAGQVLDLADELDVPVRVCTSIENFRARSPYENHQNPTAEDIRALLSANLNTHVFITGFHTGNMDTSLAELIKRRPHTYFDLTALAAGALRSDGVPKAMKILSDTQLCYGSLAPFRYMEPTLLTLEYEKSINAEVVKRAPARAFDALRI